MEKLILVIICLIFLSNSAEMNSFNKVLDLSVDVWDQISYMPIFETADEEVIYYNNFHGKNILFIDPKSSDITECRYPAKNPINIFPVSPEYLLINEHNNNQLIFYNRISGTITRNEFDYDIKYQGFKSGYSNYLFYYDFKMSILFQVVEREGNPTVIFVDSLGKGFNTIPKQYYKGNTDLSFVIHNYFLGQDETYVYFQEYLEKFNNIELCNTVIRFNKDTNKFDQLIIPSSILKNANTYSISTNYLFILSYNRDKTETIYKIHKDDFELMECFVKKP